MMLSKNFSLQEMTISQTAARRGLNNQPGQAELNNLKMLCNEVLQPLRDFVGKPVKITSGYRGPAVNRAVGGSTTSAHMYGLAADIWIPGLTVREVMHKIHGLQLPYDQLIDEFGSWVHVGLSTGTNRKQALIARTLNGRTNYSALSL